MSNAGRKTKYNPLFASQAYDLIAEHGYSGRRLAKLFKVAPSTVVEWKKEHEDFAKAVKEGQAIYDEVLVGDAEAALSSVALGGKRSSVKKERNKEGKLVVVDKKETVIPPNLNALKFLLTNLASDRWKNKVDADIKSDNVNKHEISPEMQELNERIMKNGNEAAS